MNGVAVLPEEHEAYWQALADGDEAAAIATADTCLARGVAVADVLEGMVAEAQRRVGELWARNRWTVTQEHAATAVSEAVVRHVGATLPRPQGPRVLVVCAEREWHAVPALVVAHTLRSWGVEADFLGASANREQVVGHLLDSGPRAVLLSASLVSSLARVRRHIEAVRATGTPIVVGGSAFAGSVQRARELGATAHAATAREAFDLLGSLPVSVDPAPPQHGARSVEARTIAASVDDYSRQVLAAPEVVAATRGGAEDPGVDDWRTVLATFVPHLFECTVGALLSGDPDVVRQQRAWLSDVLAARGGEVEAVEAVWTRMRVLLRDCPEALRLLEAGPHRATAGHAPAAP
jgi:methanogenic corrinoid protein MtbC1